MLGTVEVEQGGRGEAVSVRGEVLHIAIDKPYAPGAPITMVVQRPDGPLTLRGKTNGSKRRPDGRFDVMLRLVSLSRVDRARLATE